MTNLTKKFNPMNQVHVKWLKTLSSVSTITKMTNPLEMEKALKKLNLQGLLEKNPMGVKITSSDLMEFPMIHFGLAMVYTNAVLEGEAWIPTKEETR